MLKLLGVVLASWYAVMWSGIHIMVCGNVGVVFASLYAVMLGGIHIMVFDNVGWYSHHGMR